jgi:hypothetical protein
MAENKRPRWKNEDWILRVPDDNIICKHCMFRKASCLTALPANTSPTSEMISRMNEYAWYYCGRWAKLKDIRGDGNGEQET